MFEIDSPIMKEGIVIIIISFVYILATKCLIRNNNKQNDCYKINYRSLM